MSNQTILQYNGVRLQNCQTVSFVETPTYDETGKDYIHTLTTLRVVGYLTTDEHLTLGVKPMLSATPATASVPSRGASQHMAILRQYLEQPRKRLVYSTVSTTTEDDVGKPIFDILPAPDGDAFDKDAADQADDMTTRTDVHGGPYPREVNVTHVANNQVWRVEFTVEFATFFRCYDNALEPADGEQLIPTDNINDQLTLPLDQKHEAADVQRRAGILSNRWSCHDAIDDSGFTTRTYTGVLKLSNPNWNPHDFRSICIPPIRTGMKRVSTDFTASEDNLTLRWQTVDKEVPVSAPQPAFGMKVVHTESLTKQGFAGEFNIRVALQGNRNSKLLDLLVLGNAIIEQRLYFGNPIQPNTKNKLLIDRKDITSEQGTDQTYSISLVVAGRRFVEQNANNQGQNAKADVGLARNVIRSVTWRVVRSNAGALANYNNQLSFGARQGEQPATEVGIRAITALHARLSESCSKTFGVIDPVISNVNYYADRTAAMRDIEASTQDIPELLTAQIDDNIQDFNSDLKFSTEHENNLYTHYNITSEYGRNALNVALPVARTANSGPLPIANVAVTIGPQQPIRKIRIQAERVGQWPKMPDPVASFEETAFGSASSGDPKVTNTLHSSTMQHLEPRPMADGVSLLYTCYMDLVYFQNRFPAMHRTGIPQYIRPQTIAQESSDGFRDSISSITKYSAPLTDIFVSGLLSDSNSWNYT